MAEDQVSLVGYSPNMYALFGVWYDKAAGRIEGKMGAYLFKHLVINVMSDYHHLFHRTAVPIDILTGNAEYPGAGVTRQPDRQYQRAIRESVTD